MELTAPFIYKEKKKRIVYGPVLVPGEPDHDDDVVKADKIEQVAHEFIEKYGNIDVQHSLNNVGNVVESYIAPVDLNFESNYVPKGTWMMGVRVTDPHAWELVEKKKLTGFSIMGIQYAKLAQKSKDEIEAATKRTTLNDLGDDWVVNAVSLVDEPCVPKAKFVIIKSKKKEDEEPKSFFKKMKEVFKEEPPIKKGEVTGVEIKDLVTAFKEALKEYDEEKTASAAVQKNDPFEDDVEPVDQALKSVEGDESKEAEQAPDGEPQAVEGILSKEAIKQIAEELQKIESANKSAGSKRIKGQETATKSKEEDEYKQIKRDAFGFRIN